MALNIHPDARVERFEEPFVFETLHHGRPETIPYLEVAYECWGNPNHPAVLVCHALSGNTHCCDPQAPNDSKQAWWNAMVGSGKAIDTQRFFVICINMLGSCGGTSGPASSDPSHGKPYGLHFPIVTVGDMVHSQRMLLDRLGVRRLHGVIGGSMGGFQALQWITQYPDFVERAIVIASSAYSSQFQIMSNRAQINAIQMDPRYRWGRYEAGKEPLAGLTIARQIGFTTFISPQMMEHKFAKSHASQREPFADTAFHLQKLHEAENYLRNVSHRFTQDFDPNSMIYLLQTWNHFDMAVRYGSLAQALSKANAALLVVAATGDNLFPPFLAQDIVEAMHANKQPVRHELIDEIYGHDYFLLSNTIRTKIAPIVSDFMNSEAKLQAVAHAAVTQDAVAQNTVVQNVAAQDAGLQDLGAPPRVFGGKASGAHSKLTVQHSASSSDLHPGDVSHSRENPGSPSKREAAKKSDAPPLRAQA